MNCVGPEIDCAKKVAADLERVLITALTDRGLEHTRDLLRRFIYDDELTRSRETLIRMVVASMSVARLISLLPDEYNPDNLPAISSLAATYRLENALEAAQDESNPILRQALFQHASEMAAAHIDELGKAAGFTGLNTLQEDFSETGRSIWLH